MDIKGTVIIIGGSENRGTTNTGDFKNGSILSRVIAESKHKAGSRVEIIAAASGIPEELGASYMAAFRSLGAENLGMLSIKNRDSASDTFVLERLMAADTVFFTGGDQLRLKTLLFGSPFLAILNEKLQDKHFVYAGTSAGAAAVSDVMITAGSGQTVIRKGAVTTEQGFGLVGNITVDTHFMKRGRIGRLFEIIASNPTVLGIGLAEDTGFVITGGTHMECIGEGTAIIVDGHSMRATNVANIETGSPISIDNLRVHVLRKRDIYYAHTRTLLIAES
ncbi:MAG: cyanophycinase [Sphingobacteriales bacterium]|nr:MAG: cyanophycinase [Sphingobacteriales bacterium]